MDFSKRKQNRITDYDYSQDGAYFITICTKNKVPILCDIVGEGLRALPSIKLTPIGEIVDKSIEYMDKNYKNISVDKYVIMPNHVHLIISVNSGGHGDPPLQIYDIIGRFKSFTTLKFKNEFWQRSFYDHVIRDEADYLTKWNYIDENPLKWKEDEYYK